MPHSHANPQVFSARLYGKVLHDHDQVESPVAVIYTTINKCTIKQDSMDRTLQCVFNYLTNWPCNWRADPD